MGTFLLNFYSSFLRMHLGHSCKFQPTCSCYAKQAFENHGFFKATGISFFRLLRCHPFGSGGYDPVPLQQEFKHG